MEGLLHREALYEDTSRCGTCKSKKWAVWRCVDCSLPQTQCRECIRQTHFPNPFHRIERWTGTYFRAAALWEVGLYVLIPHRKGEPLCDALKWQIDCLERLERDRDEIEQRDLQASLLRFDLRPEANVRQASAAESEADDVEMAPADGSLPPEDTEEQQEAFERFLDALRADESPQDGSNAAGYGNFDPDDDTVVGDADRDVPDLPAYLAEGHRFAGSVPRSDALQNSYVRVVHINGIHHIALVTCECRGGNDLHIDLMACRLMPASFQRTRTLFSTQLLDNFRLANLEMKASAYQFYQLLRRVTLPMAPSEVVDLYNEFRRMSRLWRWMKKLKWSGFGHNDRRVDDVKDGELAIYCPACPQPGINIPADWKNDPNR